MKILCVLSESVNVKKYSDLKVKLNNSVRIKQINESIENEKYFFKEIENTSVEDYTFEILLKDVEKLKRLVELSFSKEELLLLLPSINKYLIPTGKTDRSIKVRELYYVSENRKNWISIEFGSFIENLKDGKEIYLYNTFTDFSIKISKEGMDNIVSLLDEKLPFTIVELGRINVTNGIKLDDVFKYIETEEIQYRQHLEQIKENEERLERIYKGVEFKSVEEKNRIIEIEKQTRMFCSKIHEQRHMVLWNKKEELASLPQNIFSSYIAQIVYALLDAEEREVDEYIDKITSASLNDLDYIYLALKKENFSQESLNKIEVVISKRTLQCQQVILREMTENIANMNRRELRQLVKQIEGKGFSEEIIRPFIGQIENQYNIKEQSELYNLCGNLESKKIDELQDIKKILQSGDYQKQFYDKYVNQIDNRIDYLYVQQMEAICQIVEGSDRKKLERVREEINQIPCKSLLKEKFFQKIEKQQEILDIEYLENLIVGMGNKSVDECRKIVEQLKSGEYNQKFVNGYLISAC